MPPFEKGSAYCFAAVRLSVGRFIFFAEVTQIGMQFSVLIYYNAINMQVKFDF